MFKVPDHQVAGHQAGKGKMGPLVDESGRFYKPLQSDERGARELSFYESFAVNKRIPKQIHKFFPKFYGTKVIEASDGSGMHPHLILDDIVSSYVHPCIIDLKIGSRTWYPKASEEYVKKCLVKDKDSTSLSLGFRVSGLKIYKGGELGYWSPNKKKAFAFNVEDVKFVLREFVSSCGRKSNDDDDGGPDCAFAERVYGEPYGILGQLKELKKWFEEQTFYQFNSCSVLIAYDREAVMKGSDPSLLVKLIDFAHVYKGEGVIDHNFLGGLCSLIKFVADVLNDPEQLETTDDGLLSGE